MDHLRQVRLKARRRELLQRAVEGDFVAVCFADQTQSQQWALRTAAHALVAVGLAEVTTLARARDRLIASADDEDASKLIGYASRNDIDGRRLVIRLTPLGLAVARFFAHHFENGRPVRWQEFFDAVLSGRVFIQQSVQTTGVVAYRNYTNNT